MRRVAVFLYHVSFIFHYHKARHVLCKITLLLNSLRLLAVYFSLDGGRWHMEVRSFRLEGIQTRHGWGTSYQPFAFLFRAKHSSDPKTNISCKQSKISRLSKTHLLHKVNLWSFLSCFCFYIEWAIIYFYKCSHHQRRKWGFLVMVWNLL